MIKTQKETITKEIDVYYASDGSRFTDYDEAKEYEQFLEEQGLIQMDWPWGSGLLTILRKQTDLHALERQISCFLEEPGDYPRVCIVTGADNEVVEYMSFDRFRNELFKILDIINAEIEKTKGNDTKEPHMAADFSIDVIRSVHRTVKEWNAEKEHCAAPYLTEPDMEIIEAALELMLSRQ